jgi:hypothetical protein
MIYKKYTENTHYTKRGLNADDMEEYAVLAPPVAHVVLLLPNIQ